MPFEVRLSQLSNPAAFDKAVKDHIAVLHAFNKTVGKPRPTAHPLIENAVKRVQVKGKADTYVADYVFVDDVVPEPEPAKPSVAERKHVHQHYLMQAKTKAQEAIIPDRKRPLFQIKYVAAVSKKEDTRTKADKEVIAEYEAIQKRLSAVELTFAEALHDLEDLPDDAVDSWQVPNFED